MTGIFSGLFAAILPACDAFTLPKLRPGETTMAQAREIMGAPTMKWQNADGSATWEYPRTPNGVVNYMLDFGPNERLREVRQVLTEANFSRVKEGMTREEIRRLLGQEADSKIGEVLGLDNQWVANIVAGVGNYGEVFERNIGQGSPLKIARGLNQLWTKGGIQYAPPLR